MGFGVFIEQTKKFIDVERLMLSLDVIDYD